MMTSRAWFALALFAACGNSNSGSPDGGAGKDAPKKHDAPEAIDARPDASEHLGSDFELESIQAIAYAASVTIGDGQTFQVDVDTGSTTLAVAGASCSSCQVTPEWSVDSSAVDQHKTTSAKYGDQSTWDGETYSDKVKLQGDTDVTMVFADMTDQSGFLLGGAVQGIIGFLGPAAAFPNTDSFMTKRDAAGLPTEFAFQFCPDVGHLWFGGVEPTSVASDPQFTGLATISSQQPFFALQLSKTTIGGASIGLAGTMIADTGTSLMIVSTAVENATIAKVQAASGYAGIFGTQQLSENNCLDAGSATRADIDAALPPMVFTLPKVGGGTFTLTSTATQSYLFFQEGAGYCLGMASVSQVPETILGIAFLRQYVSVFDGPDGKIGFAPQAGCTLPDAVSLAPVSHVPPHWVLRGHQR